MISSPMQTSYGGESPQDVRGRVLCNLLSPTFADIVGAPFEAYAEMHGKVRWGDKTPIYVLSIAALSRLFPSARFIHLIRDERDVASSYLSIPMFEGGIWQASLRWRDWVSAGIRSGRRLPPGRYVEVRYEDLVADTDRQLRELCSFLDLEFDGTMLNYHADAELRLQAPPDRIPFHKNTSRPPLPSTRDWRLEKCPKRTSKSSNRQQEVSWRRWGMSGLFRSYRLEVAHAPD